MGEQDRTGAQSREGWGGGRRHSTIARNEQKQGTDEEQIQGSSMAGLEGVHCTNQEASTGPKGSRIRGSSNQNTRVQNYNWPLAIFRVFLGNGHMN